MADEKQAMQADGSGTEMTEPDQHGELASRRGGTGQTGESGGGAYPNPHSGKDGSPDGPDKFLGHGGQTGMGYHGKGQLGDEKVGDNANAPAKDD